MMSEKQQSLLAMASTFPFSFYNPVLQLKAVAEGNSRLFSMHHQHPAHRSPLPSSSPPGHTPSPPGTQSLLCSPPVSREQAHRLHHHLQQEHQKTLKFSIDNILSPTFGAGAPTAAVVADDRRPPAAKQVASNKQRDKQHAASKRKYSSDSESSNSSNSTHSLQKSPKKEAASSTTSSSSKSSSSASSAKSSSKSSDDSDHGPNTNLFCPFL